MGTNEVKRDFQRMVSKLLVDQLWQRRAPWQIAREPGERYLPYNGATGLNFHGINAVWLMAVSEAKGYSDPRWLTEKQANALGAKVRPGEEGTLIEFWKFDDVRTTVDEHGQVKKERVALQKPQLFHAVLYNAAQLDGLQPAKEREPASEQQCHERATAIVQASGAKIEPWLGERAFYDPVRDRIVLPGRDQFASEDKYHATAIHELGHWTGHKSRQNRDIRHPHGSWGYAKEELRAEIASLMLGEELGIGHDPSRHDTYAGSWVRVLEGEPMSLFQAAADAEKIVHFIRGLDRSRSATVQPEAARPEGPAESRGSVAVVVRKPVDREVPGTVLLIPFAEKDEAEALGARWHQEAKCWHAPEGTKLEPLQRWLPQNQSVRVERAGQQQHPGEEFGEALRKVGLQVEGPAVMDGMRRRVKVIGDGAGEMSGSYIGYLDAHPCGLIENRRLKLQVDWKSGARVEGVGERDRARLNSEATERREERGKAMNSVWEKTAGELVAHWSLAKPVEGQGHPYLASKKVASFGLRQDAEGNLLVPLRDASGKLWSLQIIGRDGKEALAQRSVAAGKFFAMGPTGTRTMLVAEDYASAATLAQATGKTAVVTFGAGNLEAVARELRKAHPNKTIVIAAQNDAKLVPGGMESLSWKRANQAAYAVGGHVLVPKFGKGQSGTWNDLAGKGGVDEVRAQLEVGLSQVERQELVTRQQAQAAPQHGRAEVKNVALAQLSR